MSILATVAVTLPVPHARLLKVKVKLPFHVKVCVNAFTPVNVSFRQVKVATTSPFVAPVVEYFTLAVGFHVTIILFTVAVTLPRFPAKSWK
ncbi:MAG: hypothetical protein WCL18_00035 [bacterium]